MIILAIVFSQFLGARVIKKGSPRLNVRQGSLVTLELAASPHLRKLEMAVEKKSLFGRSTFSQYRTLAYFVKPNQTLIPVRIPRIKEGRVVVFTRKRDPVTRKLIVEKYFQMEKIALFVLPALPKQAIAEPEGVGGGDGGGGGGDGSGGGDGGGDRRSDPKPQPAPVAGPTARFIAPDEGERFSLGSKIDVRVQLAETAHSSLGCQQWELNGRILTSNDWTGDHSPDLSAGPCN